MSSPPRRRRRPPPRHAAATHLIIVCCHAIWLGGPSAGIDESEWLIEEFQRGETATYAAHIRAGVEAWAESEGDAAVVVFSGAATKSTTRLSEAESYLNLLKASATLCPAAAAARKPDLLACSYADTHALDSYQNLLFPVLLFHRLTGRYPGHVTLVSHSFKEARFVEIHVPALRWPRGRFTYVGIDPPGVERAVLDRGELSAGWGLWRADWYAGGERLVEKRMGRNPWGTGGEGWYGEEGVLKALVQWRGPGVYPCWLPWAEPVAGHDVTGCGNCSAALTFSDAQPLPTELCISDSSLPKKGEGQGG